MMALTGQNIHVRLGQHDVLRGVDLEVPQGDMLGLIGPNGAGKTTLLRVLAGLLSPAQGTVRFGAHISQHLSMRQLAANRAYVAQHSPQQSPYTVGEMLAMATAFRQRWYNLRPNRDAITQALAQVGAQVHLHQRFAQLSGGEQQQVLVARALLQGAPLLLLDEPTAHLDLRHRAQLMAALKDQQQRGTSVVVSLHDLNTASLFCSRLLLLHDGRVDICDTPHNVLQQARLERVYQTPLWCGEHALRHTPTVDLAP